MYTIYHIPGVKIGCSVNPKRRVKNQGYTNYEVLEQHTDLTLATKRELELQKQYKYAVDQVMYSTTIKMSSKGGQIGGKIGGKRTKELRVGAMSFESRSKVGKIRGKKNVESGHLKTISIIGGQVGGKISANKERICPYCLIKSNGIGFFRWHGDNCKAKPN